MADDRDFQGLLAIAQECWQTAHDKGWHDDEEFLAFAKTAKRHFESEDLQSGVVSQFLEAAVERLSPANGVNLPAKLMLIVSEAAEALEYYRDCKLDPTICYYLDKETGQYLPYDDGNPTVKPEGVGSELVDIMIRTLELALRAGIPIIPEFRRKMRFNNTRELRHGGKRA